MSNPYQTPESEVDIAANEKNYEYVGFWKRAVASLIDTILMMAIIVPLGIAMHGSYVASVEATFEPSSMLINYLLPALAVMAFWYYRSATPGKMIFNAVIIDAKTGNKLTKGQTAIRYLGYYVSMIPLFLGMFWVGFDRKKQGWHDKMAGTLVVRYTNDGTVKQQQESEPQD
jgi:uncharacterized RDD family membrane protein YckC